MWGYILSYTLALTNSMLCIFLCKSFKFCLIIWAQPRSLVSVLLHSSDELLRWNKWFLTEFLLIQAPLSSADKWTHAIQNSTKIMEALIIHKFRKLTFNLSKCSDRCHLLWPSGILNFTRKTHSCLILFTK